METKDEATKKSSKRKRIAAEKSPKKTDELKKGQNISAKNDTQDRISQLPDDILLKCLSVLDMKNAARTGVLSKRWQNLWTWLTNLDFDLTNLSPDGCCGTIYNDLGPEAYLNWVDGVVNAHRGPCISKFIFHFYGFDTLNHLPCKNGIRYLKSLRLQGVNLSRECVDFIMLQSHVLEELCVEESNTLHDLNITSAKLKHLAILYCPNLESIEIVASNLRRFHFEDRPMYVGTHMVFKCVPKLVEALFGGVFCAYPFFSFELGASALFKQLITLSVSPTCNDVFNVPHANHVLFPNVKQLTISTYYTMCPLFDQLLEFFINASPMLHQLKLQPYNSFTSKEARQLQEVELENDGMDEIACRQLSKTYQNPYSEAKVEEDMVGYVERKENFKYPRTQFLKVMEVYGFRGGDEDVSFALDIINNSLCLETLICDPRHFVITGARMVQYDVQDDERDTMWTRARKLAKLVPPNIRVFFRDKYGIFRLT